MYNLLMRRVVELAIEIPYSLEEALKAKEASVIRSWRNKGKLSDQVIADLLPAYPPSFRLTEQVEKWVKYMTTSPERLSKKEEDTKIREALRKLATNGHLLYFLPGTCLKIHGYLLVTSSLRLFEKW